jgi:hypothetical protein
MNGTERQLLLYADVPEMMSAEVLDAAVLGAGCLAESKPAPTSARPAAVPTCASPAAAVPTCAPAAAVHLLLRSR